MEDGNDLTLEDAGDDLIAALEALLALSSFEVDPSDPLAPVTDLANALPLSAVLAALLEDPEGAMIPEDLASLIPACGQGDLGLFDNLRGDVCSQVIPGNMPDLSSLKTEAQEFLILIDTISTIKELFDGIDLGDINLIDAMSTRIFELPLEGRVGPQGPDGPEGPEGPEGPRGPRGFSG